jgi:hypothetical protein
VLSIKTGKVLGEIDSVSWGQYTPAMQSTNINLPNPYPYDASIVGALDEYNTLKSKKEAALAEARAQAEKDFLAGKPYIDVKSTDIGPAGPGSYMITPFDSVVIANKYFKFIVGPYVK